MRNPARIRPFMEGLTNFWLSVPDMRFGQLVMNLSREPGGFADIWEWDCSDFNRRMEQAKRAAEEQAHWAGEPRLSMRPNTQPDETEGRQP